MVRASEEREAAVVHAACLRKAELGAERRSLVTLQWTCCGNRENGSESKKGVQQDTPSS